MQVKTERHMNIETQICFSQILATSLMKNEMLALECQKRKGLRCLGTKVGQCVHIRNPYDKHY